MVINFSRLGCPHCEEQPGFRRRAKRPRALPIRQRHSRTDASDAAAHHTEWIEDRNTLHKLFQVGDARYSWWAATVRSYHPGVPERLGGAASGLSVKPHADKK